MKKKLLITLFLALVVGIANAQTMVKEINPSMDYLIYILFFSLTPIGLLLDLIGVWMVYKYVLEPLPNGTGIAYPVNDFIEGPKREEERMKKINRKANIGMWLIIVGFALQFVSSILK